MSLLKANFIVQVCKAAEKTIGEAEFTIDDADVKPN